MTASVMADAITASATVDAFISYDVINTAVTWTTLSAGTSDTACTTANSCSPDQGTGQMNTTVSTNKEYKIEASGTDFTTGVYTFGIGNLKLGSSEAFGSLAVGNSTALTTGTQTIIDNVGIADTVQYQGMWITIPALQEAGTYTSTVTITASNIP
jgi:hypothetical protein